MRFASADRCYTAWLTQDLFGTWSVMQSWRGKHTYLGGGRCRPVASFEEGREVLLAIKKRRYRYADSGAKRRRESIPSLNSAPRQRACRFAAQAWAG
jgi:hypothetical protein